MKNKTNMVGKAKGINSILSFQKTNKQTDRQTNKPSKQKTKKKKRNK